MTKKVTLDALNQATTKPKAPAPTPEKRSPVIPAADAVTGADTSIKKNLPIKEINPARCKPWPHHNRNLLWLTPERCETLIDAIKKDGQKQLGLVRRIEGDPNYDYEIIYGVRRWYSCSQIEGRKFRAEVTNADDLTCARLMHQENEQSEDITEFEKACAFKEQIESGVFESQAQLADELNVSKPLVSRLMRAARILDYSDVYDLLKPQLLDVSIRGASNLVECLEDESKKGRVLKKAKALKDSSDSVGVAKIIKLLLKSAEEGSKGEEKAYLTHGKKVLVSVKRSPTGKLSITIDPAIHKHHGENAEKVAKECLEKALQEML